MNMWDERLQTFTYPCGIDEVGRGPLAGPVVACAVVMPKGAHIEGIRDSKKLTAKRRLALSEEIRKEAVAVGIGMRDNLEIDRINIKEATRLAMRDAVLALQKHDGASLLPDALFIDAEKIDLDMPQFSIIHGDDVCYPISCASIIAKVFRDELMEKFSEIYQQYEWEKNKGYGTKAHRDAILKYGMTPLHRRTFLSKILKEGEH